MNKKQIKELLKAHCTIENGRWVFKQVDIDAASLELEQAIAAKPLVIGSADILPISDEVKSEVKRLWALPSDYNNPPKVAAVKLVMQYYRDNGVECGIKKAKEVIEQHCL